MHPFGPWPARVTAADCLRMIAFMARWDETLARAELAALRRDIAAWRAGVSHLALLAPDRR